MGCDIKQDKEYKISYDLKVEPVNLDPQTASDKASLMVINNIFEGLLSVNFEGEIIPALAKSYTVSEDGLVYTFILHKNLMWEDETKLTADDFVFAFRRLLSNDTNSPYAKKYYSIKNASAVHSDKLDPSELGVRAKSETELEITLSKRNDNLPLLLTRPSAMPCNEKYFYETHGKYGLEPTTILSNGAYSLGSWKHKEYIRLDRNKNYYDYEKSTPTGVSLWINTNKVVDDEQVYYSAVDRLLDGKVLGADVSGIDVEKLPKKDYNIEPYENSTYCMIFNQNNKYLNNRNLRLAIATAFSRESYSNSLHGSYSIADAIIPHSVMIEGQSFREFAGEDIAVKYDTIKAFELYKLALSELNKSSVPTLKMIVPKTPGISISNYISFPSQIIQKELGIFISIEELELADYNKRLAAREFDVALVELSPSNGEAGSVLNSFYSSSPKNYYGYKNGSFDMLMDSAETLADSIMINESIKSAERMLISDAVLIPIYYKMDYLATSKDILNMKKNPQNGLITFKNIVPS